MSGDEPWKAQVLLAATGATTFVKDYFYRVYDSGARHELSNMYREHSVLVWNGRAEKGIAGIIGFLTKLPPTKHHINSIDGQPTPGFASDVLNIQVSVSGTVQYGSNHAQEFTQMILLAQDRSQNNFYVASDCFRFCHAL
eukprot:GFYU01002879.1.p1 GENE.GFYU01002879.1~~GFYU01002879.1.p1  ORF type:complete len:149 (+),score=36.06 GFYU01002879.1:30-449(+)